MRPSTLPKVVMTPSAGGLSLPDGPAASPICVPCMPSPKNTPSSKNAARRSRAVILPRACCFSILSSPPSSLAFSRLASRSATRSRIVVIGSLSCPLRCAFLEERHQALAGVVGRETLGQPVAQERQGLLDSQVVLRGEGPQAQAHRG